MPTPTPARNKRALTAKQEAAVQHYALEGNMTAAYKHAYRTSGMLPATINRSASELFGKPHVAAAVAEIRQASAAASALSREEALAILARIARGELAEYLDDAEHIQPGVVGIRDPIRAIERIAQMCGWDKQQPVALQGVTIELNIGEADG